MKIINNIVLAFMLLLFMTACTASPFENGDKNKEKSANIKYGSLVVNRKSIEDRVNYILPSNVTKATAALYYFDGEEVKTIIKSDIPAVNGVTGEFTIEGIPVGSNRVLVLSAADYPKLQVSAVFDIVEGENEVKALNLASSLDGHLFLEIIKANADFSNDDIAFLKSFVGKVKELVTHYSLIDFEKIVTGFIAEDLTAVSTNYSDYKKEVFSVKFTLGSVPQAGSKAYVDDVTSPLVDLTATGDITINNVSSGEHKLIVILNGIEMEFIVNTADATEGIVTIADAIEMPDTITFYFKSEGWEKDIEIHGPFTSTSWTSVALVLDESIGWYKGTVEVTDASAAITYQLRFKNETDEPKFQKGTAVWTGDPVFTTTTGKIWLDGSSGYSWKPLAGGETQVYDFFLAADKITEAKPVTNYTLTLDGEGLSSNPLAGSIAENTEVTITITAPEGKEISAFTVDSVDKKGDIVSNEYTFTLTKNTEVAITYVPKKYTLTLEGVNITALPEPTEGKYEHGTEITITVTPSAEKRVASFTVGGVDKKTELLGGIVNEYKFEITGDTTVVVTYENIPKYVLTLTQDAGGTMTSNPEPGEILENTEVTITVTPDGDKRVATFTVGGVSKKSDLDSGTPNEFKFFITAATTVVVTYEDIPSTTHTLTLVGDNISSSPAAGVIVTGTTVTITVAPAAGKMVDTFTVGGDDKKAELLGGTVNRFTFTIEADVTVKVTYADMPKVATPVITSSSILSGTGQDYQPDSIDIIITTATDGAVIYYTLDGEDPTTSSTLYESTFAISVNTRIKAIAVKSDYVNSDISEKVYTKTVFRVCVDAYGVMLHFKGDIAPLNWTPSSETGKAKWTTGNNWYFVTWEIDAGETVSFKTLRRNGTGGGAWENGDNRSVIAGNESPNGHNGWVEWSGTGF